MSYKITKRLVISQESFLRKMIYGYDMKIPEKIIKLFAENYPKFEDNKITFRCETEHDRRSVDFDYKQVEKVYKLKVKKVVEGDSTTKIIKVKRKWKMLWLWNIEDEFEEYDIINNINIEYFK